MYEKATVYEILNLVNNKYYIRRACVKKKVSAGGFQWSYELNVNDKINKIHSLAKKECCILDLSGNLLETYDSVKEAAKKLKVKERSLAAVCLGHSKRIKKYQACYKKDLKFNINKEYFTKRGNEKIFIAKLGEK